MKNRDLHALLVSTGLILGLSGCGDRKSEFAAPTLTGESEQSGGEVRILTWDEYFSPEIATQFRKETGIDVHFDFFSNVEEMKGKLRSQPGAFDLVVTDGGTLADLIELQVLREFDHQSIENLTNLDAKYLNSPFDPGNRYSVPYMWGTTLVAYRTDLIPEIEESWKSLWDERFAGKVAMLDEQTDSYAVALLSLGLELNSTRPEDLAAATAALVRQVNPLGNQFLDFKSAKDRLLSGEVWVCVTYSSDAATLAEEGGNIGYFLPKEGAPVWVDSFVIPKETANEANAHRFVDFLCRSDIAAANANFLWGATVNRAAKEGLNPELVSDLALYPNQETAAKCLLLSAADSVRVRFTNQGMKQVYDLLAKRAGPASAASATASALRVEEEP